MIMKTILGSELSLKLSLDKAIWITKIVIIAFIAVYLFGNFTPFYEGNDSYTLGTIAIHLSQDDFVTSNQLLEKTGRFEFVPGDWFQTIDGKNAFPGGPAGFHYFTSFLYSIGNNFSLFYLGPALGVLFLIISERVATKLFDKYVGLLTLLFLTTNHIFFGSSLNLGVDIIFSLFFISGTYFLVKFFKDYSPNKILLASLFFIFATFTRINGIIFLPIEIFLVVIFFLIYKKPYVNPAVNSDINNKNQKLIQLSRKNILKISVLLIIPWIGFLLFWFGYNEFFYGDPLTNYVIEQRGYENTDAKVSSLWTIESKHLENFKQYSKYLLPYQFPAMETKFFDQFNNLLGTFWLGISSLAVLFSSLVVAFKIKHHRMGLLVFTALILGTIWFFASVTSEERATFGVPGRYIMPSFTIFYMALGFLIVTAFRKSSDLANSKLWIGKFFQVSIILILGIFFISAFYFTPPLELIKANTYELKNPIVFAQGHPPDLEGLTEKSVIMAIKTDRVLEYDVIPFHILPMEQGGSQESIDLLKDIIQEEHDIFIFKKPTTSLEKGLFNNLVDNHGFVMKDFSQSFCKVTLIENTKSEISDSICLDK